MSHGIIQPIDRVLSKRGTEWHGLAEVVTTLDKATVSPLLFPIITGNIIVDVQGAQVAMGNHKALLADFRLTRPDLLNHSATSAGLVPLHIPKKSYRPIENGELWNVMEKALRDVGAEVTCVGTLEAAKKFFISVDIGTGSDFTVNGDRFLANLNFVTSHDGTIGVRAFDSMVRIVCMNTLRASLAAQGETSFTIYHTSGADVAMANLGDLLNAVLTGRATFRTDMEYLANCGITASDARLVALGYFAKYTGSETLSTRCINAAEEIAVLFSRGAGNKGQTLYDLLNGATEYWTNGNGTGKTADAGTKAYKANFGEAADHKNAFQNLLMGADSVDALREAGAKAQAEMDAKAKAS